jgi:hypothetical protein
MVTVTSMQSLLQLVCPSLVKQTWTVANTVYLQEL